MTIMTIMVHATTNTRPEVCRRHHSLHWCDSIKRWTSALVLLGGAGGCFLSFHRDAALQDRSFFNGRRRTASETPTRTTSKTTRRITEKTILFLHGVGGHADEYDDIIDFIRTKYGEENAPIMHSIDVCEGPCSLFTNMIQQRDDMTEYLKNHIHDLNLTNGYHWVAHSQGSVLARAVIQNLDLPPDRLQQQTGDHNTTRVDYMGGRNTHYDGLLKPPETFVSMAGPQMGQWGNCSMSRADIPEKILKTMTRPLGWIVFYNALAQHELSIANYWHDPNHRSRMIEEAALLPMLNGYIDHGKDKDNDNSTGTDHMSKAKSNFLRIRKAVFVGSIDDDCINPPLSSVFQFLDGDEKPVGLEDTMEYQDDTFGLKTMMDEGRLFVQDYPGLHHLSWRDPRVFEKYVLPHLLVDDEDEADHDDNNDHDTAALSVGRW